jgi:hypothetical protein
MFKAMQQDDEERAMLRERVAELEAQIREMVDKAAARSLDGYRELGRRAAQAEERAEKAEAERIFWKGRTLELEGKLNNVEAELAEARKVLAFVRPYVYGIDNIKRIDAALAKECGT